MSAAHAPPQPPGTPAGPSHLRVLAILAGATPRLGWELVLLLPVLLGAGALVFGPHVVDGGYQSDDWSWTALYEIQVRGRLLDGIARMLERMQDLPAYRPGVAVYFPVVGEVVGSRPAALLGWTVLLGVFMSLALFALLRELGLERLHAAVIAVLVLIYPYSDATRLWPAAGPTNASYTAFFVGGVLALRAFRARGWRSLVLHVASLLLYAVSVLTYEATAPLIVAGGFAYVARAGWRAAAPRWAVDMALVLISFLVTRQTTRGASSLGTTIDHAVEMGRQALTILARTAMPVGAPPTVTVIGGLLCVATASVVVLRLLDGGDPARAALRRWLLLAGLGLVAAVLGYAAYAPADPNVYLPELPGTYNRVNGLASIGLVVTVYSCAMLVALLLFRGLPRWRAWTVGALLLACLFLAYGYAKGVRTDAYRWDSAARLGREGLARLKASVPALPSGSLVFTFNYPLLYSGGVSVLSTAPELSSALALTYRKTGLFGMPMGIGRSLTCSAKAVQPHYPPPTETTPGPAPYGRTWLVDLATGRAVRLDSAAECRRQLPRFAPGPFSVLPG